MNLSNSLLLDEVTALTYLTLNFVNSNPFAVVLSRAIIT